MAIERRWLMTAWMVALAVGLVVTIGAPAAFTLLLDLIWWR